MFGALVSFSVKRCVWMGLAVAVGMVSPRVAPAQQGGTEKLWKDGPLTANLGTVAEIKVPENYGFIGKENIRKFNDLTKNLTSPNELGVILPIGGGDWYIIFAYYDEGYIKDDEKDKLDAAALLKSMQEAEVQANAERKRRGMPELTIIGWERSPFYDSGTHNLTWALRNRSAGAGEGINYQSRILGRGGYMSATLVVSPQELNATVPVYDKLLTGFSYKSGQKYSEWRAGDKVAAYGLTALVAGGAGAVAAKTGLLGKLLKPLIAAIAAAAAGIGAFFRKLFGRKKTISETGETGPAE